MKAIKSSLDNYWIEDTPYIEKERLNVKYPSINVDTTKTFQTHFGFGGAFTESTTSTILEHDALSEFVKACYSPSGLNYNLGRLPIHSSDFAKESYTYIEEGDETLETFSMEHDKERFMVVKECLKECPNMWLMASSWSPCPFMKSNKNMLHGGKLLPQYYDLWARYLAKSLKGLKDIGIAISALTIQNEPQAVQTWESCIYTGEEEGKLALMISDKLKEVGLDSVKLYIWDHNRDLIVDRVKETLSVPGVKDIVYGVAYHWYVSNEFSNLSKVHELYPDLHIMLSECCVEAVTTDKRKRLRNGVRYASQIINDFNNYSEGYLDWNMVLDYYGGPNHAHNYCESPIMVEEKSGKLEYLPSYYYIGHFSKYIKPGSKRVLTTSDNKDIEAVSYIDSKGIITIVVLNTKNKKATINLQVDKKGYELSLEPYGIVTIVI